ncbi:ChaB family protein [Nostoc sp.]|uniref:ChaB family protein n=1 Tax=Nostoc sp. TaxID=1180 RepID=UPI003B61AB05
MPYKQIADLPDSVNENLPKHAQEIFRAAFTAEFKYLNHICRRGARPCAPTAQSTRSAK